MNRTKTAAEARLMMNTNELARRMKTITHADFLCMLRHVRAGEGPTMVRGNTHTLKQANAAYEWVHRYGGIQPYEDQCAPDVTRYEAALEEARRALRAHNSPEELRPAFGAGGCVKALSDLLAAIDAKS